MAKTNAKLVISHRITKPDGSEIRGARHQIHVRLTEEQVEGIRRLDKAIIDAVSQCNTDSELVEMWIEGITI